MKKLLLLIMVVIGFSSANAAHLHYTERNVDIDVSNPSTPGVDVNVVMVQHATRKLSKLRGELITIDKLGNKTLLYVAKSSEYLFEIIPSASVFEEFQKDCKVDPDKTFSIIVVANDGVSLITGSCKN